MSRRKRPAPAAIVPEPGEIAGANDKAGRLLWLAVYDEAWLIWWTQGAGYLFPPRPLGASADDWFREREWEWK